MLSSSGRTSEVGKERVLGETNKHTAADVDGRMADPPFSDGRIQVGVLSVKSAPTLPDRIRVCRLPSISAGMIGLGSRRMGYPAPVGELQVDCEVLDPLEVQCWGESAW